MRLDTDTLGLSASAAALLRDLIHERTGLFYENGRFDMMIDRVGPLVVDRGFQSLLDYYYLLKYDGAEQHEWRRVMDALAVNETYFWREVDQLRAVVDVLVPALAAGRGERALRIWSVPCASGEEPLTIAMLLDAAGWFARAPIEIVGSDASEAALEQARRGVYRERSFRNLPAAWRERYFTRAGDRWAIDPALQRRVTWTVVNLMSQCEAAPFATSPIVICRNLFIYFSERAIRDVVGFLAARMPAPGYLCVGASESLLKLTTEFTLEEIGGAFVYVKR